VPFHRLCRIALLPLSAATCTPFKDDPPGDAGVSGGTDAGPLVALPCDPSQPFGNVALVSWITLDTARSIAALRLSRDDLTGYFQASGRSDSAGYDDLYTARRTGLSSFDNVQPIVGSEVNTSFEEFAPTVSGDGLTLVFARGPAGDPVHLWHAARATADMAFTGVASLNGVNDIGTMDDTFPFLREDGKVLYFASTRVPADGFDLYSAEWRGLSFDTPMPVKELNTGYSELAPVVTFDGLTMYFGSDRSDGNASGQDDIWMATRTSVSDLFSTPMNLTKINSPKEDLPTFATRDGCALYFSSDRGGTLQVYVATKPAR
jgi:hypothetical protein